MIRRRTRRMSLNGFCSGAIAGLVTVTPASGFVQPHYAIVFGLVGNWKEKLRISKLQVQLLIAFWSLKGGLLCMLACDIKHVSRYKYDDACDVFAGK